MNNFYILSFDIKRLSVPYDKFIVYISNNKSIADWHSPFDGCVVIFAKDPIEIISKSIFDFLGSSSPFFLAEIAEGDSFGAVPDAMWEWFRKPRSGVKIELTISDKSTKKIDESGEI
ncbi:hypothetical protein ACQKJZ_18830 [Sphingomonas sp. NPDC019816]|uniref:hypothetical protein n=1 Tax=Sphingomonas sp. NPDC019816 TaxID=3390679 RepID=UPI003D073DB2